MFCENCGKELKAGSRFCEFCGAPVPGAAEGTAPGTAAAAGAAAWNTAGAPGPMPGPVQGMAQGAGPDTYREHPEAGGTAEIRGTQVTENVCLCPDGKYRWVYEFDMLRNPAILITVLKVMGLSVGIVALFVIIVSLVQGDSLALSGDDSKILGILIIVFLVLILFSYLVVAGINGWKYVVFFEMDEEGVTHNQMEKQVKKGQALGWLAALAGMLAGRPGVAGAGMLAATKSSSRSDFSHVRTVKANRALHTIYVNQLLGRNQVYAEDPDFDFVLNFIKSHTGK